MAERGEFARIAGIVAALAPGRGVLVGPGDDAAVLRPEPGRDLVVTTDTFVEGRHWRAGRDDAGTIGRRLAAAQLSDVAAMAATPRWAVVSCVAPAGSDADQQRAVELACARALEAEAPRWSAATSRRPTARWRGPSR
ncbi:MAG: AIR synthase related protein [Candidatus Eisenbacteria bacterium]